MKKILGIVVLITFAAATFAPTGTVFAQDSVTIDEIRVTARKRDESLHEVPVTITAFSRDDITQLDLRQLENVSNLTPGFQFKNQGNQQPGRYNTQLQFRGLTTAQFSPSFATGALFIDGVYVLNGGTSLSLMDVERIEVIKGPQAAYFGRNTFGGAVNLITRDPNAESWSADVSVATSDRSNNDISAFVEGPLVKNVLSGSLGVRLYDKKGHYTATDGGRMGNEETVSYNAAFKWTPTDSLSLKLRYGYSEDDDGAPAQAYISGLVNDNCTGLTIQSPEGPANPTRYICGQVPDINTARSFGGGPILSSNTILPANVASFLTDPATNISGVPGVTAVGLKRETERLTFQAEYDINGYSLELVYGNNDQQANWIRDFDLSDRVNWFSRDPQSMEDESIEFRISGPQDGRLRWLAGVNRYEQDFTSSGGGGDSSSSCFVFSGVTAMVGLTDDPANCAPNFVFSFPNNLRESDTAEVLGIFAAMDFDINDQWTLAIEGRYQQDELTKGTGLINPGEAILRDSFDKFLPRVIARYQPTDATNLFFSYSQGQIAGDFNTNFIGVDDRVRAQILAQEPDLTEALAAEELTSLELGWKQYWLDGAIQTNLAIYRQEWTNIKGRSSVQVNETCLASDIAANMGAGNLGCSVADGQMVGDPKRLFDGMGGSEPLLNSRNVLLPGDADIDGVEIETWFRPDDDTVITANVSYIDSSYTDYAFNFVSPIAGFSQQRGNSTPRQPKWTGNATLTQLVNFAGYEGYVRGEMLYQGRAFVDESNLAYIDDYTLFNARAGISTDKYLVEIFVKNILDEDAWATGARWTDFSSPTQFPFLTAKQGVAVSPQDRREFGIRATYRFGTR